MINEYQALMIGIIGLAISNLIFFICITFYLEQLRKRLDANCTKDDGGQE